MSENRTGGALNTLALLAGLTVFVGVGGLALMVGLSWRPENTSSVITATAAVCGGGLAVFATVFGVFLGLAVYRRMTAHGPEPREYQPSMIAYPPIANLPRPWQEPHPPLLANPDKAGTWAGGGPTTYDLWRDAPIDAPYFETTGGKP